MKVESVTFIAPCSDDFAHWNGLQGFSSENERSQFFQLLFQNKTGIKYSIKQFVYQISGKFNKLLNCNQTNKTNCNSSNNIALCGLVKCLASRLPDMALLDKGHAVKYS